MHKTIAGSLLFFAGEALAHPNHGAPAVHLHGWEYVLLAVVAAAVAICAVKK